MHEGLSGLKRSSLRFYFEKRSETDHDYVCVWFRRKAMVEKIAGNYSTLILSDVSDSTSDVEIFRSNVMQVKQECNHNSTILFFPEQKNGGSLIPRYVACRKYRNFNQAERETRHEQEIRVTRPLSFASLKTFFLNYPKTAFGWFWIAF